MVKKKCDYNHINVAKLEATIKDVNLALKWGLKETEIEIDSATVRSRIHSVILNEKIDYLAIFRDPEGNGRRHN